MFYVPRKIQAKLDPRWRYGIWLGRAINADESYIATSDGRVTRARAIVRLIETARWDATKILAVKGKPGDKFVDGLEKIEEDKQPHLGLDEEPPEGEDPHTKARMRMRITLRYLAKYGFTKGCARCNMHQLGKTSGVNHNEECRLRIYQAMTDASDSKLKKTKNLGLDEKELREPQLKEDPSPEPTTFEPIEEKNPVESAGEPDKDDQGTFDEVFDEMFCGDNDDNLITDDGDTPDIEINNIEDSDMGEHDEYDAMVSVLQTLGVHVLQAVAYTKSIYQKRPTTFMEVYGRGGLSDLALGQRRSLNLSGLAALDLRTQKPNGQPWDFTKKSDQKEAVGIWKELKPDWVLLGSSVLFSLPWHCLSELP